MKSLRRHLLHAVDLVLARPEVSDLPRNEAVSLKKLLQGDGCWSTQKVVLGWIIDTLRQTLELPPHRRLTLETLFQELKDRRRISRKQYERYLGQLRFVSVAIPGSAGLFGALQLALNKCAGPRLRISTSLRHHLDTFHRLAKDLAYRPTHLAEIVPQLPSLLGATDAAKAGMGGVFFAPDGQGHLWPISCSYRGA